MSWTIPCCNTSVYVGRCTYAGPVVIKDIFPPSGHVQRLTCSDCDGWLDLAYADFDETVSGARIAVKGLPVLRCSTCEKDYLADRSRISIIRLHEQCVSKVSAGVTVTRRKLEDRYRAVPV